MNSALSCSLLHVLLAVVRGVDAHRFVHLAASADASIEHRAAQASDQQAGDRMASHTQRCQHCAGRDGYRAFGIGDVLRLVSARATCAARLGIAAHATMSRLSLSLAGGGHEKLPLKV